MNWCLYEIWAWFCWNISSDLYENNGNDEKYIIYLIYINQTTKIRFIDL